MAQTFYPITPTEIVVGANDEWTDMDASALIPVGATGVILHAVNNALSGKDIGLKKKGSTDDRHADMESSSHWWTMVGVDGDRLFEAYVEEASTMDIYVVGYTMAGVTFKTNADDMSIGTTKDWIEIDASTEAPNATGLIFELSSSSGGYREFGFKKNGSSDDRHFDTYKHHSFCAVIGCDASQLCEGYVEDLAVDFYLIGYITDGVTFNLNATDLSMTSYDAWLDLTALPDENPVMAIIEVTGTVGATNEYGLRKDGSAEEIYEDAPAHPWAIVECAERIIEGYVKTVGTGFFLVGYAIEVEAPPEANIPAIMAHYRRMREA